MNEIVREMLAVTAELDKLRRRGFTAYIDSQAGMCRVCVYPPGRPNKEAIIGGWFTTPTCAWDDVRERIPAESAKPETPVGAVHLNRDERELIAKALTSYKCDLKRESPTDLVEYNRIVIAECDEFATKLNLDRDYYTWEK